MKSTVFAWIVLVILVGMLGFFTYIKFTYEEEPKDVINNNQANSIPLSNIENNYNSLEQLTELKNNGITTIASIEDSNLKITCSYSDIEDSTKNYNYAYIFTFTNGILKNTTNISNNQSELDALNLVFKNLANAVSVSQGNDQNSALLTIELVSDQSYVSDTFKIINTDTDITYVIDTTKPINLYEASIKYAEVAIIEINAQGHAVIMNNNTIENISFEFSNSDEFQGFALKAYLTDTNNEGKIILKIYDQNKVELASQELNISDITTTAFTINIPLTEDFKQEDVAFYSVEIKEND